jgi:kynurenine formamidase
MSNGAFLAATNSGSSSKVEAWLVAAHEYPAVQPHRGIDVTTSASSKRACFPSSLLPPLRALTAEDVLRELVKVPNVRATVGGAFAAGAVAAVALLLSAGRWAGWRRDGVGTDAQVWSLVTAIWPAALTRTLPPRRAWRLLVLLVTAAWLRRWMRRRAPTAAPSITKPLDVSSSRDGVCIVTTRTVFVSNSHAGTHADRPGHFLPPSATGGEEFHRACYTGDAVVLDLSGPLARRRHAQRAADRAAAAAGTPATPAAAPRRNVIDQAMLAEAARDAKLDLALCWRLLIRTRGGRRKTLDGTAAASTPSDAEEAALDGPRDEWTDDFAHLTREAAQFLTAACPRLLLFGVDTPSVDWCCASPIAHHVHGVLWASRVAIVENLNLAPVAAHQAMTSATALEAAAAAGGSHRRRGASQSALAAAAATEAQNETAAVAVDAAHEFAPCRAIRGAMVTSFLEHQRFEDAEGCMVTFYPYT